MEGSHLMQYSLFEHDEQITNHLPISLQYCKWNTKLEKYLKQWLDLCGLIKDKRGGREVFTTGMPCLSPWIRYTRRVPVMTAVRGANALNQK